MPALILTTPGARATLVSERLRVELPPAPGAPPGSPPPPPHDVHLHDVEQVILSEHASLSTAALAELMRRAIPVHLTGASGRVLGLFHPPGPHSRARALQYQRAADPAFSLAIASALVEAKILNQRRVLQRLAASRDSLEITPALLQLKTLAESCPRAASLDTLRGIEGTAAGRHFETYALFFPPAIPFERRSRRPPLNPPNAILSFAYTLLASEAEAALHAAGLDPSAGFYHEPQDRRASLALDLIEPFRAPLADALALDLLTHQTLQPARHFDRRDGGVFLNTEGRKRFFVAYERRMERPFTSEQTRARTTLRQELHNQARALKHTILHNEPFLPFLMN